MQLWGKFSLYRECLNKLTKYTCCRTVDLLFVQLTEQKEPWFNTQKLYGAILWVCLVVFLCLIKTPLIHQLSRTRSSQYLPSLYRKVGKVSKWMYCTSWWRIWACSSWMLFVGISRSWMTRCASSISPWRSLTSCSYCSYCTTASWIRKEMALLVRLIVLQNVEYSTEICRESCELYGLIREKLVSYECH